MIHGLSQRRRLPRLGKIKLGVMTTSASGKRQPQATHYFVVPEAVAKVHGDRPSALPIMLPVDDPAVLFPQVYKLYRTAGLWCSGDGQTARRWTERGELEERGCPCEYLERAECGPEATLNFLLPDVPGIGVWQIVTGNKRSIVSLNTALEQFGRAFGGLSGIPFTLRLEPEQISRWDTRQGKLVRQTLHVLRLDTELTLRRIVEWRMQAGAKVMALMPVAEPEAEDRVGREDGTDERTTEADVPATPAPATPAPLGSDSRAASAAPDARAALADPGASGGPSAVEPTAAPDAPWDISMAFAAAARWGIAPALYEAFFTRAYGHPTSEYTGPEADEQRRLFAAVAASADAQRKLRAAVGEGRGQLITALLAQGLAGVRAAPGRRGQGGRG